MDVKLLSLPPEVLVRILSNLDSYHDVAAFSLSCRKLHGMCDMPTRKRFHSIRIWPTNKGINQAFELVMSMLKRPFLGQYVRDLRYYGRPRYSGIWKGGKRGSYPRDLSQKDLSLLKRVIQLAGFSGSAEETVLDMAIQKETGDFDGKRQYSNGYKLHHQLSRIFNPYEANQLIRMNTSLSGVYIAQALAVILIVMAPNLVSMTMTQPYQTWEGAREENLPLKAFMRRANRDPENLPYLQNLREIYMIVDLSGKCDDDRYYNHIEFLDCFNLFDQLPSITSVGIDTLADDVQDEPLVEQRTSNLTELCINHSSVSTPYLARAILACKVLKKFQYSIGGRAEDEQNGFGDKIFLKAILAHRTTLESLDLDTEINIYNARWDIDDEFEILDEEDYNHEFLASLWETHGTLKDFIALKNLSLAIDVLFYMIRGDNELSEQQEKTRLLEGLPDNLETLCIRGYQRGQFPKWQAEIDDLMLAFRSGSTKLKEIRGIEENIPGSEHAAFPDEEWLWTLNEIGYGIGESPIHRAA
ncbi:hypothetical protein N7540_007611 [Penicillium herquei]|nr:hypothetical protein N7540_007611 [Penicillium herquei]